jgi:hypothetical protein
MGLRPTLPDENQRRHPREGGGPCPAELDSRLRGSDVLGVYSRRVPTGLQPARVHENPVGIPGRGTPWRAPSIAGKGVFGGVETSRRQPPPSGLRPEKCGRRLVSNSSTPGLFDGAEGRNGRQGPQTKTKEDFLA